MSKILKVLSLATCAGVCLMLAALLLSLSRPDETLFKILSELNSWQALQEWFGAWLIGFLICLIFGSPSLLVIDKYFASFSSRYIVGGTVAGWVAWFFLCGPLFTPKPWFDASSWISGGINYVGIYLWLGFCTGLLFTVMLSALETTHGEKK